MLLLLHPTAWSQGFFSQHIGDLDWTPRFLCPSKRRALLITLQHIWKEVALVLSLLLFWWVISPPTRREKQASSHQRKRCVPNTRWLNYSWHSSASHQVKQNRQESCLLQMATRPTVGMFPWEGRNSSKPPNTEPLPDENVGFSCPGPRPATDACREV